MIYNFRHDRSGTNEILARIDSDKQISQGGGKGADLDLCKDDFVAKTFVHYNAELRGMIADRSYHRLLQLDWIRADVDGDGRREYVPHDDQIGPRPPEHSYELFATGSPTIKPGTKRRFYFGGNIYKGWSTVPEQYKAPGFSRPWSSRHTIRIFTFRF